MKTYAKVESNQITNKAEFEDSTSVPVNWIDVTGIDCCIGDLVKNDVPVQCPSIYHIIVDGEWVVDFENTPDFNAIKSIKKTELANSCKAAITLTPITSDALGSIHSYDCRETDQINARMAYTIAYSTSTSQNIMCNDGTRFEPRAHTAAQAFDVISEMFNHIENQRAKLMIKAGEVDAIDAGSYENPQDAIDAINGVYW